MMRRQVVCLAPLLLSAALYRCVGTNPDLPGEDADTAADGTVDADAEQLVEVVQKQKTSLDALNKNYNAAVQERDVAVTNSNELYLSLQKALDQQAQSETTAVIYREVLRQRGGIPLAVQHIAIKP